MRASSQTVRLPRSVVAGLYEASVRFEQIIETMEVLLDKKTVQRIRLGENEYRKKAYVLARDAEEIRKVLSSLTIRRSFYASSLGGYGVFIQD